MNFYCLPKTDECSCEGGTYCPPFGAADVLPGCYEPCGIAGCQDGMECRQFDGPCDGTSEEHESIALCVPGQTDEEPGICALADQYQTCPECDDGPVTCTFGDYSQTQNSCGDCQARGALYAQLCAEAIMVSADEIDQETQCTSDNGTCPCEDGTFCPPIGADDIPPGCYEPCGIIGCRDDEECRQFESACDENNDEPCETIALCIPISDNRTCTVIDGDLAVTYAHGEKWYDVEGCSIFECYDGTVQQIVDCALGTVCVEHESGLTCVPDGESSCSVGEGLESVTYADGEKWYDVEGCSIFECDDGTIQQIVMDLSAGHCMCRVR